MTKLPLSRADRALQERLRQTREYDAAHEAMMREAANDAGASLGDIRRMRMRDKDKALIAMFRKARSA